MLYRILDLIIGWARKPGRWPILLVLGIPVSFLFTQEYFALPLRGTFQHWFFWISSGGVLIAMCFSFLFLLLEHTQLHYHLLLPLGLFITGTVLIANGYNRIQYEQDKTYVETYHDEILGVLKDLFPGALADQNDKLALLGEFYEKGIDGEPYFHVARKLYEKAAKAGSHRAAVNLSLMYQDGRGVERNLTKAKFWLLKAGGAFDIDAPLEVINISDDMLEEFVLTGLIDDDQAKQIKIAPPEIQVIEPPITAHVTGGSSMPEVVTRQDLKRLTVIGRVVAADDIYDLRINNETQALDENGLFKADVPLHPDGTVVKVVAIDRKARRSELAFRIQPNTGVGSQPAIQLRSAPAQTPKDINFGHYYALVIGINEYQHLPQLRTPIADADAISRVLKERYGFHVTLLYNADRYSILSVLNTMRKRLTERDNLLVYYAGHGELDQVNARGHWLPSDASQESSANWISNVAITDILNVIAARSIIVISDSCYSGALTRSALTRLETGMSDEARLKWLKAIATKRSRTVLTSGGLSPVLDSGGGNHSVFAKAVVDTLTNNSGILSGQDLYREVSARVAYKASSGGFDQVPLYAPIRYAGHEAGDFLFVPTSVAEKNKH